MPPEELKVGVLALQGAFAKHRQMLGVPSIEVRTQAELDSCDGLIIPGGESTTMNRLNDLDIKNFNRPIFGTCAGLILMTQLGLLDIEVERNAYGRHIASRIEQISLNSSTFEAVFIRAPQITNILSDKVQLLTDQPYLIRQGPHLAATFHPELTNDPTIHHYFVEICKTEKRSRQPQLTTTPIKSSPTT